MGGLTLRADPDKPGRGKLPVRAPQRRKPLPRWVKRAAIWGGIGTLTLGLAGGGIVLVRQGHLPTIAGAIGDGALATSGAVGLKVREVLVEGRNRVQPQTVMAMIGVTRGAPILGVSVADLRMRLESIPWIESAVVERRLPDKLFVRLVERQPLALWQHEGRFVVIDAKGVVVQQEPGEFANLPVVVGADAPQNAEALLLLLATEPELQRRVTAAVRVGGRRWNLKLDNGIDVALPEEDAAAAWSRLAVLERENKVLSRDVVTVDMRLPDRLIVRVGADAASQLNPPEKPARGSGKR